MEALKSCPFCGGEPTEVVRKGKDGWRDRYAVLCDYEHGGCGAESGWYHYRNEAVEAWNRRITSKGTSEQIATNFSNITRSPEALAEFNGDEYTGEWERHECEECNGTGEIDEYKLSIGFQKFFPDRVRNSREFYIRTCPTEKLIDIIHNLIRWNKPIPGVFFENTDAEDKKAIETWLQEEFKGE